MSEFIILHELSPDLQQTAYSFDVTIHLQDFRTGVIDLVLEGHTKAVKRFTYSPCGRWIASGGKDRIIRLWDLHNGGQSHILSESDAESEVASDAESDDAPDAALDTEFEEDELDTEFDEGEMDTESDEGEPDAESNEDESDVESEDGASDAEPEHEVPYQIALTFTSTGLRLALGINDGMVNVYDTQSKELLTATTIEDQGVSALAYSPNNQELAIGGTAGAVFFWDPSQSDEPGYTLNGGPAAVRSISYSPWKDWLAYGDEGMKVHLCRRRLTQSESSDMEPSWSVVYVVEGFLQATMVGDDGGDTSVTVELVWGSNIGMLGAVGMRLDGVVGLDAGSRRLLEQRGAVGDFLSDEADVGSDGVLEVAGEN
ncbi:MAG: WD40-repeat-containing domain protein [Linnemannia elongata]|nr:MAG: WD40-repeat-containing domain protein [Linnemannia elongata]